MGIRISQLSANALPYTGRELIPLVQSATTRAGTLSSFVNYLSGALLADSELRPLSGVWQSTYTTTYANSANWSNSYTTTNANSGNWNSTYNTVNSLSSTWSGAINILPTVTNYLSTNNVLISAATISENISSRRAVIAAQSIIPLTVVTTSIDRLFTITDTNKVFHFDTTAGPLTASFPRSIAQGFNVGIMNVGTNYLHLSSNNAQINALGDKLVEQFAGAYVYRFNSDIYAVGGF